MFPKKTTTEDLQQELLHGIMNLDPKKMGMLLMDGPNVNWLVLKLVNEHQKLMSWQNSYQQVCTFSFRNELI